MTSTLDKPAEKPALEPVDSPCQELYFVMWLAIDGGMWRVFTRDDGSQAIARTLERAEAMLADAKKFIAENSKGARLAAVSLRIAKSQTEEI